MRNFVMVITLCVLSVITALAQNRHVKKDTVRDMQSQPKRHIVKGKRAREAMQLRQINHHEKEMKKVHKADREVQKEKHPSHQ